MKENKATILAVDDEENNLRLLKLDLEDNGYKVITAKDGKEALEHLRNNKYIQLVLLDRMMPNMNGMEVLEKIKSDKELQEIPVIMQTAAAEKSQIIEGIKAGVYYYLTKPFDGNVMLAIVNNALENHANNNKLREEALRFKFLPNLFDAGEIKVKDLLEAQQVSAFLANMFPQPEKVIIAISELIINGIEHGNLGIDYETKKQLVIEGKWEAEINTKLSLPENKDKVVRINFLKQSDAYTLTIEDQGEGFDFKKYMDFSIDRITDPNGRGIAISATCFDKLEYIGKGNKVICSIATNYGEVANAP